MALFSKRNLKPQNPYGLTEEDLIDDLKNFPMGIVICMLEEQELQGNTPDVKVFQHNKNSGFAWSAAGMGREFWRSVIIDNDFDLFFKEYPEYMDYNI